MAQVSLVPTVAGQGGALTARGGVNRTPVTAARVPGLGHRPPGNHPRPVAPDRVTPVSTRSTPSVSMVSSAGPSHKRQFFGLASSAAGKREPPTPDEIVGSARP